MLAYMMPLVVAIELDSVPEFMAASVTMEKDRYNDRGINISAQKRRQELVPWTTVKYNKKRAEEEEEKKETEDDDDGEDM
jgi:hypothetical protein